MLNHVDSYRRRKGNSNPKPKLACPFPGCFRYVVCVADHCRHFHGQSVRALGDVKRTVLSASKGVTNTGMHVLSVTNGVTDNLPVSDKIITLASDETYEPLLQVTAVACENPLFPVTISGITVEIHQYPVDINQYPIENPQNSGATNEEVATSPGLPPHFKTLFASFHNYMCNVEAVSKARPEMYVLGACQVMEAVGMDLACLTRL